MTEVRDFHNQIEKSENQLVIFSLLNNSVETCTTSLSMWIRNSRLWWILLKMTIVVANQIVNDHFKSTRSLQVDWKTLEGQNMYLREEKLSQWMQSTVSSKYAQVTLPAHSIKYIYVLNLPAPAQTLTLTVWGFCANTYCLFCCLHWKWQILTF